MFGPLGSNIYGCAFWPNQPIEPPVHISSSGPGNILIMQHLRDPATIYAGAVWMRAALGQRARLVSVNQGGHAVYGVSPNTCANNTATAYLVNGTLPQSDSYCPAEVAPVSPAAPIRQNAPREAAINELLRRTMPGGG